MGGCGNSVVDRETEGGRAVRVSSTRALQISIIKSSLLSRSLFVLTKVRRAMEYARGGVSILITMCITFDAKFVGERSRVTDLFAFGSRLRAYLDP